ncbi:3-phosphoshikimate 1-carboxyvinyltransferase [Candidatus Magnetaquicoccus inordinatus]|uniref:3-phosphoshikimate 1-carboxyvinyltransferase n=1 Tax=Candidatus Magnetaquicoccus inordinatus TaxID=2496818 RepID=UPI00102BCC1B|nr:3-phosphoshikimate 1-carboxyvinyltransferase [Candidatus Magnetaquicoccus inordinatus]
MNEAQATDTLSSRAATRLHGETTVPGDKSISHRSIMLGALAEGETEVHHLLEGEDVLRTVAAFRNMGVEIVRDDAGIYRIQGVGLDGLREADDVLDMGNSGTAMRLLSGVLASQPFFTVLTGDASLRQRPMKRVITPLSQMGARIFSRDQGRAPLVIQGSELIPIDYTMPVASAQVKSAILLAALNTAGGSSVLEPEWSRDHTERMLLAFGADVRREGMRVTVEGWPNLRAQHITVPGDISSAAFPLVAALLVPGSEILLPGVGVNPTRTGLLELLTMMGAHIEQRQPRVAGGEPIADLYVRSAPLHGIEVPAALIPRAIDEFPVFCIAAALAEGETRLSGAAELRVKESDRIHAMAVGLQSLGVTVTELADGLHITGRPEGLAGGVTVDSFTDHRIAMSFLVAGLRCREPVVVTRCANIQTSFPTFRAIMSHLGAQIS